MNAVDLAPAQLDAMLADTRRLRAAFAGTADRDWDAATAATELAVQLGHLAQCVRRDDLNEPVPVDEQRPITDAGDELADVVLAALSVWTLSAAPPRDPELHRALRTVATGSPPADGPAALLRLVSASGALAEIAMVENGLRHRPGGAVPPLPDAVAAVLATCLTLACIRHLDLAGEFARMVRDADGFITRAQPASAQPGEFSTHERTGSQVRKRLGADHLTGRDLPVPAGSAGSEHLLRYLDTLRHAGIRLPADLAVAPGTPLTVTYTWLDGPTLAEATSTAPATVVTSVREIISWLRTLDDTDARIDTNLATSASPTVRRRSSTCCPR